MNVAENLKNYIVGSLAGALYTHVLVIELSSHIRVSFSHLDLERAPPLTLHNDILGCMLLGQGMTKPLTSELNGGFFYRFYYYLPYIFNANPRRVRTISNIFVLDYFLVQHEQCEPKAVNSKERCLEGVNSTGT